MIGFLVIMMPFRFELESGEDVGKRESIECFIRFGSSDSTLGRCGASLSELEVDEDIGKRESAECLIRFGSSNSALGRYGASPSEPEVDEDIGKRESAECHVGSDTGITTLFDRI